jgi:hypothetical protein
MVLTKLGDEKGALQELLKTAPSPVAFNNMGVLYSQEGKFDRARQFFEQALKLEPRYDVAQNNLRAIEALMPPSAIIALPSFEVHAPIPNVECPPPEPAPVPTVETDTTAPSLPEPASFVGPAGIVAPVVPEPQHPATSDDRPAHKSVSHSSPPKSANRSIEQRNEVQPPAAIEQKQPEPESKPSARQPAETPATVTSAPDRACIVSQKQSEDSQTLGSRLKLEDPRLAMGGIIGLLGTLLMVGRSRQQARLMLLRQQQNILDSRK